MAQRGRRAQGRRSLGASAVCYHAELCGETFRHVRHDVIRYELSVCRMVAVRDVVGNRRELRNDCEIRVTGVDPEVSVSIAAASTPSFQRNNTQ
jgi:hypothetical protein